MDWVLYSQHAGKFQHLQDSNNLMCVAAERALSRNGEITENSAGVRTTLNDGQEATVNANKNTTVTEHKQLDYIANIHDDAIYRTGEDIKTENNRFG